MEKSFHPRKSEFKILMVPRRAVGSVTEFHARGPGSINGVGLEI